MNKEKKIQYANEQLIGEGNIGAVDILFSPDYIAHAVDKEYRGHESLKQFLRQMRDEIPDISVLKIEFLLESEDTIAWQRTLCGSHLINMMGIKRLKKRKWNELGVTRFEGDKIAEEWLTSEFVEQVMENRLNG